MRKIAQWHMSSTLIAHYFHNRQVPRSNLADAIKPGFGTQFRLKASLGCCLRKLQMSLFPQSRQQNNQ